MAERSQPVFRDFLSAGLRVTGKQPEFSVTDSVRFSQHSGGLAGWEDGEVSTRACSTYSSGSAPAPVMAAAPKNFLNSSDHGSEMWQRASNGPGKIYRDKDVTVNGLGQRLSSKRTLSPNCSPLREPLQVNKSCSEAFQSSKVSLFHQRDSNVGEANLSNSQVDLSLRQQPLESSSPVSIWLQTSVFKSDLTTGSSKRIKCSKPTVLNLASSSGAVALAAPLVCDSSIHISTSENIASGSVLCQVPGDEGSRTGLRGSGLSQASPFLHPLNLASGKASAVPTSCPQIAAPVNRSLTVFYGGQAHVFDDVNPEKVDAIMMLAGSNGRSWSTVYAPRGLVDELSLGSDALLINSSDKKDAGKFKEKIISCCPSLSETVLPNLL